QDGEEVAPGCIRIAPPGLNISTADGRIHLSQPDAGVGPKPSVDYLFNALADDYGENAVGVILSGTGTDGAGGIRAIKAGGGITIAQEAATAKFNGMPQAAIDTRLVDLVLPPDRIGLELPELFDHPPRLGRDEEGLSDDINGVLRLIKRSTGNDFTEYKPNTISRRVKRRMAVNKIDKLGDYIHYLEHSEREVELLNQDILVSVTSFFRDPEAFEALGNALEKLVESKRYGDEIRIWVAGCASGEEAYSVAIQLDRVLGGRRGEFRVQVFGTDLDGDAIVRARKGIYPAISLEELDPGIVDRYFIRAENAFQVSKEVREMVVFARHNLVKDPPFSRVDLVSCRNVLIYFQNSLQRRVLPMFHYVMNPGGYLFLGRSESVGQYGELFEPLFKGEKIFRRRASVGGGYALQTEQEFPQRAYQPKSDAGPQKKIEFTLRDTMNQALADAYAHPAVLVDEQMQIRHVRGDVTPFLRIVQGDLDLNVFSLIRDELRLDLRALVYKASREHQALHSHTLHLHDGEEHQAVVLHARPVKVDELAPDMLLLAFEQQETASQEAEFCRAPGGPSDDPRLRELEQELAATKEHLQTTVEELETANEELQSLNEELQSSNEELQSSNEELETSNEELQSTNEELTTVNEEFQVKSAELTEANTYLQNILGNLDFALLVVDRNLHITRFNPPSQDLFEISALEVGQVLTSIPTRLELPNLRDDVKQVITSSEPYSRTVNDGTRTYEMRILPCFSDHSDTIGALLMFHGEATE
ncbi:MAG TPA: CheR family methyltransferase, partial [Gammaproteobacteria bacterium]|nr:CheR family methyltransferase [Gammaproteobacteria bacterium]